MSIVRAIPQTIPPSNRVVPISLKLLAQNTLLRSSKTKSSRHFHQISERVGLHFLHHLAAMGLYSDLADTEFPTNLFVSTMSDGSDFDGIAVTANGLEDVSKMPALIAILLNRGYAEGNL